MDPRSNTRRARMLIPFVGLAIGCGGTVAMDSMGDYRNFRFSAAQPYFAQGGKVDFGTYNGFRRYHSDCHVCHGPAGIGSSYAPSLLAAVKIMSFHEFVDVIVRGRSTQANFVMPGFANNMNVLPYLHDLYAYLRARSDGVVGAARPQRFPKLRMAGMGMGGMPGMGGMSGMGMGGRSGMGMGHMSGMGMGGRSGMGMDHMSGMGMGGISGMGMGGRSGMGMGGRSGMGMGGMSGMGMGHMSGMSMGTMSDMAMGGMPGMTGVSGAYTTGPDGSVYLFPKGTDGMSGMVGGAR